MNVLIQDIATRRYLTETYRWTNHIGEARRFDNSSEALQFCFDHRLQGAQIVLNFGPAAFDIPVPIMGVGGMAPFRRSETAPLRKVALGKWLIYALVLLAMTSLLT